MRKNFNQDRKTLVEGNVALPAEQIATFRLFHVVHI
jgi:hypothetical protein